MVIQEHDFDFFSGFAGGSQTLGYLRPVIDVVQLRIQWAEMQSCRVLAS